MTATLLSLVRSGLFDGLSDDTLLSVAHGAAVVELGDATPIVVEGDVGDAFFVVRTGRVRVHTTAPDGSEVELDHIGPGDHFGEQALLQLGRQRTRTASVTTTEPTVLLRFDGAVLDALMDADPALRSRLEALGRRHLDNRLARRTELVRTLMAAARHTEREVAPGEVVVRAGAPATHSYGVLTGAVLLHEERGDTLVRVGRLGAGLSFGNDGQHAHTVTAEVHTRLWMVPHATLADLSDAQEAVAHQQAAVSRAWSLPRKGLVTQVVGVLDGIPCIDQHYDLRDGRTVVASQLVGDDGLRVATLDVPVVRTVAGSDGRFRLHLDSVGRACGLVAHGSHEAVPAAMARVLDGSVVPDAELARLTTRGRLLHTASRLACTCLRVRRDTALAILEDGDVDTLQRRTGAGSVCGTCLPGLHALADHQTFISVVLSGLEHPTDTVHRLVLRRADGTPLPVGKPGQHVVLRHTTPQRTVDRTDTLCNAPGQPWELLVKVQPGDAFSDWLTREAQEGDTLLASPPSGTCTWDGGPAPVLVFAAGIGITPGLAILNTLLAEGWPHRVVVDWSIRREAERVLLGSMGTVPNLDLRVRVTTSGPRLSPDDVTAWVRRFPSAVAFVCGPPEYERDIRGWLRSAGLPEDRVRIASFHLEAG